MVCYEELVAWQEVREIWEAPGYGTHPKQGLLTATQSVIEFPPQETQ